MKTARSGGSLTETPIKPTAGSRESSLSKAPDFKFSCVSRESDQTAATTLSDRSWTKSPLSMSLREPEEMMAPFPLTHDISDMPESPVPTSPETTKKLLVTPTSAKSTDFEANTRSAAEGQRATRKALVGMIAKVMMNNDDGGEELDVTRVGYQDVSEEAKQIISIMESHTPPHPLSPRHASIDDLRAASIAHHQHALDSSVHSAVLPSRPPLTSDEDSPVASPKSRGSSCSRGVSRASSAMSHRERNSRTRQGRGVSTARDVMCRSNAENDALPRMPARKGSGSELKGMPRVQEVAVANERWVAEIDAGRPVRSIDIINEPPSDISADHIESFVLSRIPKFVQEQLPEEEWKRIFAAAAESRKRTTNESKSSSRSGSRKSGDRSLSTSQSRGSTSASSSKISVVDHVPPSTKAKGASELDRIPASPDKGSEIIESVLDETSTVISGITNALDDFGSPKPRMKRESIDLPTAVPVRAWKDTTKSRAPQMPSRTLTQRHMSAPLSPMQTMISKANSPRRKSESALVDKPQHRISFDCVQIRYYERILDVNPSTSSGPSVGLGWRYDEEEVIDFEEIDDSRRTDPHGLVLSRSERERMLKDLGYTPREIAQAVRLSLKSKNQRKQTYNNLRHERVEYLVEKSKRQVGRLLRFGSITKSQPLVNDPERSSRRRASFRSEKTSSSNSDGSSAGSMNAFLKSSKL